MISNISYRLISPNIQYKIKGLDHTTNVPSQYSTVLSPLSRMKQYLVLYQDFHGLMNILLPLLYLYRYRTINNHNPIHTYVRKLLNLHHLRHLLYRLYGTGTFTAKTIISRKRVSWTAINNITTTCSWQPSFRN